MIKCTSHGCNLEFVSKQAVNVHLKRKHPECVPKVNKTSGWASKAPVICTFCSKQFSNKFSLQRHQESCKPQSEDVQLQLLKKELETKDVQTENLLLKQKIENLQHECELKAQHAEEIKKIVQTTQPTTVINNVHNVHNVQNSSRNSYTQNNTLIASRQQIESLVPISSDSLTKMLQSTFDKALQSKVVIETLESLCDKWVTNELKDSLISTDVSRGIVHWKDGDQNNKAIKDPKCLLLSEKLTKVLTMKMLREYLLFLQSEGKAVAEIDPYEATKFIKSQLLLTNLTAQTRDNEVIKEIGPLLTKYTKSTSQPTDNLLDFAEYKKQYNSLTVAIETVYSDNIFEIVSSPPEKIGRVWLQPLQQKRLLTFCADCVHLVHPDSKQNLQHFLDFVKFCVIEAFDQPNKQLLTSVKLHLKQPGVTNDQIEPNFYKFVEWFCFDRNKERRMGICEYEHQLLSFCRQDHADPKALLEEQIDVLLHP
jgi:hypothetical protein